MGHRSWFTFTRTATEAHILASNLEKISEEEPSVYGVNFILKLDEPYKGKHFAIAWSGDGSGTRLAAKGHVNDTELLDEMGDEWVDRPLRHGKVLDPEELRA